MNKEALFIGAPLKFKDICYVYPPTIREVITCENFPLYRQILTVTREDIEDSYVENKIDLSQMLSPFEQLFNLAIYDQKMKDLVVAAFKFFIREDVFFLYEKKQLLIGDITNKKKRDNLRFLTEEDYFDFQNYIRAALGEKIVEKLDKKLNPRIAAMKAKARLRDRIKAKQKNGGITLETLMSSLCFMNCGITPLNIGELSYAAAQMLLQRYQEKEKYDLDIKSLLAGADSKKVHPKYWVTNLE